MFTFEEKPVNNVVAVNGTDSERSRSPSPELDLANDSNYLPRSADGYSSASADTGNSIFNANYLMSDDKQISQILKEANSINNVHQNNVQENKVKVWSGFFGCLLSFVVCEIVSGDGGESAGIGEPKSRNTESFEQISSKARQKFYGAVRKFKDTER